MVKGAKRKELYQIPGCRWRISDSDNYQAEMAAIIHLPRQSCGVDAAWTSRASLLGFQVPLLILAKLWANQRLLDLLAAQRSFSGEELSNVESESLLDGSEVVHGLDELRLDSSLLEEAQ